ncbi:MAG TPA: hypothetical protein VLA82_08945 [Actinomycetota bacterium]|nr:hypothetical protein [Actinomycetota bacterium]
MPTRHELERLPTKELHDRALQLARDRTDAGFLWELLKALPVAEAAIGDQERSKIDILRPLALINDFFDADEGELGEALRPMYVDYLEEHAED